MNYTIKEVHISTIKHGDVILHNGDIKTVSRYFMKLDKFMGLTLYGDCYNFGYKPVKKLIINKAV